MKISTSLKALAIVVAASSFGFAGAASAHDDDDRPGAVAAGIIGQVIGTAIEVEAAKEAAAEQDHRCARLARRCDDGEGWACEKMDAECGD